MNYLSFPWTNCNQIMEIQYSLEELIISLSRSTPASLRNREIYNTSNRDANSLILNTKNLGRMNMRRVL